MTDITKNKSRSQVPIHEIDGTRVVLDQDLAEIFDVETRVLNQAVQRKKHKFPVGWRIRLSDQQFADLKSQDVISSDTWGGRRSPPWAFTEHGVVLASTMINSDRATELTRYIVEAFVAFQKQEHSRSELIPVETKMLPQPSRLEALQAHLDRLLNQQIKIDGSDSIREQTWSLVGGTFENARERLKREGLKNAEIEERIHQMATERQKTGADIEQTNAETERMRLDAQIEAVRAAMIAERAMQTEDTADFIALMNAMARK